MQCSSLVFYLQHLTNDKQPVLPNKNMKSAMLSLNMRLLCHDDFRAIRMIYNQDVTRDNAQYDDTCRRDFPMMFLQKLMHRLAFVLGLVYIALAITSTSIFVLTLIYLLVRYFTRNTTNSLKTQISTQSVVRQPIKGNKIRTGPRGYLHHDEMQ
jgi:hypothetical protein